MSKRKRFNLSDDINNGITDVMNAVNNNVGSFRYEVVALTRIEADPENPRELLITDKEIRFGIATEDAQQLARKKREKEELESLAHTIKNNGIINPIVVYKYNEKYRIIAGERRYLAAVLAGKDDIHARILDKKPSEIDLKLLQWIENNERTSLSLKERLKNLQAIIDAYKKDHNGEVVTGEVLKQLTGLSKAQSYFYMAVLKCPNDLKECIHNGKINNLDKAAFIAGIENQYLRNKILLACLEGNSIKQLKELMAAEKNKAKEQLAKKDPMKKRGRVGQYVHLGKTKDIDAVKKIVSIIIAHPQYSKYANQFTDADWSEYGKASVAFQKLISIMLKD